MQDLKEFTTLYLTDESPKKTTNIKRKWKQLSRLQRNLFLVAILALGLFIYGILQRLYILDQLFSKDNQKATFNFNDKSNIIHVNIFKEHENMADSKREYRHRENNLEILAENVIVNNYLPVPHNDIKQNAQTRISNISKTANHVSFPKDEDEIKRSIKGDNMKREFKGPTNERQEKVVEAVRHSWNGYKQYAWGHDNLKPISQGFHDWFGLGLTIVDSLDTFYILNLMEEYEEARNWIANSLDFNINKDVNLFEVTIRVLGGLLSIYHLTNDKIYYNKAVDLGNRLLPCFDSPSSIPFSDVNLATMKAHAPKWSPDSSTSEVTTIQLEFRELSKITNDKSFEIAVKKVSEKVHDLPKTDGLVPIFINANTGTFRTFATISLGARGDSYYEYLLKQWIAGGKTENYLIDDYKLAINGVIKHLRKVTPNEKLVYIGELISGKEFKPKMDHLTCYLPGTLLLGYKNGMPVSHLNLAFELFETCHQIYSKQPTGLSPEIAYFNLEGDSASDIYVKTNDAHNLLRPEFVESLYYFYALTGNSSYQDMGWTIFQAFNKYTRVSNGYTSIGNVKTPENVKPRDMMESFWLGETLKYFYLLFADDVNEIDLKRFVFNTEAHILPIRDN